MPQRLFCYQPLAAACHIQRTDVGKLDETRTLARKVQHVLGAASIGKPCLLDWQIEPCIRGAVDEHGCSRLYMRSDVVVQAHIGPSDIRENGRCVLEWNAFRPARQEDDSVVRQIPGKLLNKRPPYYAGRAADDCYWRVVTIFAQTASMFG
jgi:hypothetical protein